MAQDQQIITCAAGTWTELSNADVLGPLTFQVLGVQLYKGSEVAGAPVYIRGTTTSAAPSTSLTKGLLYDAGLGEAGKLLSDLFTASGIVRIWGRPVTNNDAPVYIDHA